MLGFRSTGRNLYGSRTEPVCQLEPKLGSRPPKLVYGSKPKIGSRVGFLRVGTSK